MPCSFNRWVLLIPTYIKRHPASYILEVLKVLYLVPVFVFVFVSAFVFVYYSYLLIGKAVLCIHLCSEV